MMQMAFSPFSRHGRFPDGNPTRPTNNPRLAQIPSRAEENEFPRPSPCFRHGFSGWKGDNCLLTSGSAYVDLSFSSLIA